MHVSHLVLLHDAVDRALERAADAIQRKDLRSQGAYIGAALVDLHRLANSTDPTATADLEVSFQCAYIDISNLLLEANIRRDANPLRLASYTLAILRTRLSAFAPGRPKSLAN